MATMEQVRQVREMREANYAAWEASERHDRELARMQEKVARPMGRTLGHAAEDAGGVLVASFTAGLLADNLHSYAAVEQEPRAAVLPIETRRYFGATALNNELRVNPSTPVLNTPELYTGYAA